MLIGRGWSGGGVSCRKINTCGLELGGWDKGWNWCQESWTPEAGRAQGKESSGMGTVY